MKGGSYLGLLGLLSLCACASYYRVEDPSSAAIYYTKDVDHVGHGAVRFRDEASQSTVTLQNSEVTEIPRQTFLRATGED